MGKQFNPEQFEKLKGMDMARYAIEISKTGELPADFVDYFRLNAGRWDGQHLEMALFLVSKLDTDISRHLIADHVGHPLKHIRLTVVGFIDQFAALDGYVLSRIQERVRVADDKFEADWLKGLLEKAQKSTKPRRGLLARLLHKG